MKTSIIVITFICGCITSTYSQINQNGKRDITADSLSKVYHDLDPIISSKKMTHPNSIYDNKTVEPYLFNGSKWASVMPTKALVHDNMPCYEPQGLFPMTVIKPDTTTKYALLIKGTNTSVAPATHFMNPSVTK